MDGVKITDMAAIGSSPTYYDFDAFEEIQVTTGGTDVSIATGGVQLNMVTKRGTNEWRGIGPLLPDRRRLAVGSGDLPRATPAPARTSRPFESSQPIDEIDESGAELGFPIWKDHFWGWVYKSENDIKNLVGRRHLDRTILRERRGQAQRPVRQPPTRRWLQYNEGDKIKYGRNAGPTRPPETTWNQTGPAEIIKIEDTHVFSSNFFLTGLWSSVDGGFRSCRRAASTPTVFVDRRRRLPRQLPATSHRDRDVTQYRLDGSVFFNTGATANELKFGGSYREAETLSIIRLSEATALVYGCELYGCGSNSRRGPTAPTRWRPTIYRDWRRRATTEYTSLWVQDTLTMGNLTVNAGLRYDLQEGAQRAADRGAGHQSAASTSSPHWPSRATTGAASSGRPSRRGSA